MRKVLVVGGSNGIGLAIAIKLLDEYDKVVIADKSEPAIKNEKIEYLPVNLTECDYSAFDGHSDTDTLIITAGFGRASLFETFIPKEIENSFRVNAESVIQIIKKFYPKLMSCENFDCMVMGSIAGLVSSPMFSVYAATKAALCRFIESINIELKMCGTKNRILNVSPGSLKGTRFNGGENEPDVLSGVVGEIIRKMRNKETLYIPQYEDVYKDVIRRYVEDSEKFGTESYEYKLKSNRISDKPQVKIGYLSGTFDLFHIGHLNLLKRAKEKCDYLIVGVHESGAWKGKETYIPFDERVAILESIKYVDRVVMSEKEDCDAWEKYGYNYLFVGSDYKGTERFMRYEEFFKDKDVEIVYFPYTKGTSSTQLRDALSKKVEKNG